MATNPNGVFSQPITALSALAITPQLITADVSLPTTAVSLESAHDLFCQLNTHEFVTTALTGSNNDLTFIAKTPGDQSVTVTYADPSANNASLSVTVSTQAITVHLATGSGGAITSTAAQVKAAIEATATAAALVVVSLATGNDGTGVVTALSSTPLAGPLGTNPTLDVTFKHGVSSGTVATHSAFTQATTATTQFKSFATVAGYGQFLFDIGGTASPVFAVSVDVYYRPGAF